MPVPVDDPYDELGTFIPDKYRDALKYTLRNIRRELKGYGDNKTTIPIGSPGTARVPFEEYAELAWSLEYLAEENIITYAETENDCSIEIINRYQLELLNLELEDEQFDLPNLVYYQPTTGRGFVNGRAIKLTGRSKGLFDALFVVAPESVDRKTLLKLATVGKYKDALSQYVVSEAFSSLRSACKTDATVIMLNDSGRLNAEVVRLNA